MKYEYGKEIIKLIEKAEQNNIEAIETLTDKIVENIENDKIIHTFGTGHSHLIGIELFGRAGGLGNINAMLDPDVLTSNGAQRSSELEKLPGLADVIYNSYKIEKGDIMIMCLILEEILCLLKWLKDVKKKVFIVLLLLI